MPVCLAEQNTWKGVILPTETSGNDNYTVWVIPWWNKISHMEVTSVMDFVNILQDNYTCWSVLATKVNTRDRAPPLQGHTPSSWPLYFSQNVWFYFCPKLRCILLEIVILKLGGYQTCKMRKNVAAFLQEQEFPTFVSCFVRFIYLLYHSAHPVHDALDCQASKNTRFIPFAPSTQYICEVL